MFMGEYQHNIDAKGRLIIPAKLRDALGETFIVTRGLDGCLFVYPMDGWEKFELNMDKMPKMTSKEARTFIRFFYSAASECEFDKQGRINIPANLRAHANLEKSCIIIGAAERLEIWDEARWKKFSEEAAESFDEIAETLIDYGF